MRRYHFLKIESHRLGANSHRCQAPAIGNSKREEEAKGDREAIDWCLILIESVRKIADEVLIERCQLNHTNLIDLVSNPVHRCGCAHRHFLKGYIENVTTFYEEGRPGMIFYELNRAALARKKRA
jgi:hypothetical protein